MGLSVSYTDSYNPDFINLVRMLDLELKSLYGELQKDYEPYNRLAFIHDVILIDSDGLPVACGSFKEYDPETVELKRMFVRPEYRRQGLARTVIHHLEEIARKNGYRYAALETGIKQPEAIALYQSAGYEVIPNYGPYAGNSNSVCMRKKL